MNRLGKYEPLVLEEELADEIPVCVMTKEVTDKPTMVLMERHPLVSKLKKGPWEKPLERKNCL